jgi:preprotein translocase subunit YajC
MMRIIQTCLIGLSLAVATAAGAQTPPVKAGDTVFDTSGGEIGKITGMSGDSAIVDTGSHKVAIPANAFGAGAKGPVLSATKAQVDDFGAQADAAAAAALTAALKAGTIVHGINGATLGTVLSVADGLVELQTPKGAVKLPQTAFASDGTALKIGMNEAEFDAAVTAATAPR